MDSIFWVLSKVSWVVADPNSSLLFILLIGTALLWTRRDKVGRWLISAVSLIILILAFFPVTSLLVLTLEERFPTPNILPERLDGIIAMGGAENPVITSAHDQPSINQSSERLIAFVSLANRFPEAKLVYTGGMGDVLLQDYDRSDTTRMVFRQLGLDEKRVQFESKSKNTSESAVDSYNLVNPQKDEKWLLITSAYHMPRSVGVFREIGWEVIPYPVDYSTVDRVTWGYGSLREVDSFSVALKEWLGIFAYWITGRTSELFPGPAG